MNAEGQPCTTDFAHVVKRQDVQAAWDTLQGLRSKYDRLAEEEKPETARWHGIGECAISLLAHNAVSLTMRLAIADLYSQVIYGSHRDTVALCHNQRTASFCKDFCRAHCGRM